MKPILRKSLAVTTMPTIALAAVLSFSPLVAPAQNQPSASEQRETPGQAFDDASITAKVKAELVKDDTVKARQVKVTTHKGVVQLSGYVSTKEEKEQAESATLRVSGVRAVENNIIVKD